MCVYVCFMVHVREGWSFVCAIVAVVCYRTGKTNDPVKVYTQPVNVAIKRTSHDDH